MSATKQRILICDDDPAILRVLQVNLEIEGYDVLAAQNGEEAVEVATRGASRSRDLGHHDAAS